jgi:signal peptidase II
VRKTLFTAFAIWLTDLLTKLWAIAHFSDGPQEIIGSLLRFTLIRNSGAAFSFATGATVFLTALSLSVAIAIIYYLPRITAPGWRLVAALVLGGVSGNLTDRFFRDPGFFIGSVIDWIQIPNWPVFNIADSSIVIAGVIGFVLSVRNIPLITPLK